MKRDNEHTATEAERQQLIRRFLAGETTVSEEHRLYGLLKNAASTEEERVLLSILPHPTSDNDIDTWLSEDETATYDAIIRQRHRRIFAVRWAAAAIFIGLVFVMGMHFGHNTTYSDSTEHNSMTVLNATSDTPSTTCLMSPPSQPQHTSTQTGPQSPTSNQASEKRKETPKTPTAPPSLATAIPNITASNTVTTAVTPAGMTAADSMTILLERMERDLDNLSDSVYLAHVEQIIKADARFQKLMNKIIINNITRQDKPTEAYNTDKQ